MIKLLFSPYGAIKRWPFFGGLILLFFFLMVISMIGIFGMAAIFTLFGDNAAQASQQTSFTAISTAWQQHDLAAVFSPSNLMGELTIVLFVAEIILMFWSKICLTMKRLRDLDVSPWWFLLPYVLGIVASTPLAKNIFLAMINLLVLLTFYLVLIFYPSRINSD